MKKGFMLTHRSKSHYTFMVEKAGAGARSSWSYHPQPGEGEEWKSVCLISTLVIDQNTHARTHTHN